MSNFNNIIFVSLFSILLFIFEFLDCLSNGGASLKFKFDKIVKLLFEILLLFIEILLLLLFILSSL